MEIVFGPVPSRRFGRSLGVNHIPDKHCTYACVYCQLGTVKTVPAQQMTFYEKDVIIQSVRERVVELRRKNEEVSFITFVPDGEPTLDVFLGDYARELRDLGVPLAVISNASLVSLKSIREELALFDTVSLKIDAVTNRVWRRINRPHHSLKLNDILEGIREFSQEYEGTLITETMLVQDYQDTRELQETAKFLASLHKLDTAFLSIPTRPPALKGIHPPQEDFIHQAYHVFTRYLGEKRVQLLNIYEGNQFTRGANLEESLLSILAVHPMRKDAVLQFLDEGTRDSHAFLESLLHSGKIIKLMYEGYEYYMLPLKGRKKEKGS